MAADNFEPIWATGFMSGTSLDAVDAATILTDGEDIYAFGPVSERKYQPNERAILQRATDAARQWNWTGPQPEHAFAEARRTLLRTHAETWEKVAAVDLLGASSPKAPNHTLGQQTSPPSTGLISLIGVHGQTVLHRRPTGMAKGATLQLMDAPGLAEVTRRPVVHDFRTADVLAGGEGAPLAPIYHAALMRRLSRDEPMVVLNLGGVANITARVGNGEILAFDTGPANGPIDEWVEGHGQGSCDIDGRLAAAGQVHEGLLAGLFEHPWFNEPPPKSLDRYDFNASMARGLSLADGAATLTAFSARAVAAGLARLDEPPSRVIACGGGRRNPVLMAMLAEALPCPLQTAEDVGWRGDSIEAEAFALLAVRTLRGLPISFPTTTGVPKPLSGGSIARPAISTRIEANDT